MAAAGGGGNDRLFPFNAPIGATVDQLIPSPMKIILSRVNNDVREELLFEALKIANTIKFEDINKNIVQNYLDLNGITYENWNLSNRNKVINEIKKALIAAYPSANIHRVSRSIQNTPNNYYGRVVPVNQWNSNKKRLLDALFYIEKAMIDQIVSHERQIIVQNYINSHFSDRVQKLKKKLEDAYTNRMEAGPLINIRKPKINKLFQIAQQQPSQNLLNLFSGAAAAGGGGAAETVRIPPPPSSPPPAYMRPKLPSTSRVSNRVFQRQSKNGAAAAGGGGGAATQQGGRKTRKNRKSSRRTRRR
jgi:hypothetical protein